MTLTKKHGGALGGTALAAPSSTDTRRHVTDQEPRDASEWQEATKLFPLHRGVQALPPNENAGCYGRHGRHQHPGAGSRDEGDIDPRSTCAGANGATKATTEGAPTPHRHRHRHRSSRYARATASRRRRAPRFSPRARATLDRPGPPWAGATRNESQRGRVSGRCFALALL